MKSMRCPDCGSQQFYVKDPEDQYEILEFDLVNGKIVFPDTATESNPPEVAAETETYCSRCAWHDKFNTLK